MPAIRYAAFLMLGLLLASTPVAAAVQSLEIVSRNGVHAFSVDVATTEAQREKGLMFRKHLPSGYGMLFDFHGEEDVAMWMKNTYVPLDMIFIRDDGRILRIAKHTEPLSTKIIPSGGKVRAVLEVKGGTADELGIEAGDRVAFPIFSGR